MALACSIVPFFFVCVQKENIAMGDEIVVGDHQPLHSKEGRSTISLIFFKFISAIFLAGAICYLFVSNFDTWTVDAEKCIFFALH